MRVFFTIVVVLYSTTYGWSQEIKPDSLQQAMEIDTTFISGNSQVVPIESYAKKYDPRKALYYSAVFPGAGQIYNKKYWKVPLVYGGFGVLLYVAGAYNQLYKESREDYFLLINDPASPQVSPGGYTKDQLNTLINSYRRERDFFLILNGFWYILQMVDAHVDAHLKEFDLNPKMQVKLEPAFENSLASGRSIGISLKFKF